MTKTTMTRKEVALALTVLCSKCGRLPNKMCRNTKTGEVKSVPHIERLQLAKNPPKVADTHALNRPPVFKPDPSAKLTAHQKGVMNVLTEKIHALGGYAEFIGPVSVGPIISTYRFLPQKNTKVAKLEAMAKDFAVALGAEAVLVKRMPGETSVGVFVPNPERTIIKFSDTLERVTDYAGKKTKDGHLSIPMNFGEDQTGHPFIDDLTELPHLLIAGSTNSGKSTLMHCLLGSMALARTPRQLKILISDTKGVEFRHFSELPHLQFPIATSVYQTMEQLQWAVDETQDRLNKIATKDARNIHDYNALVSEQDRIPYVVIIIDELADLMGQMIPVPEAKLNSAKLSSLVARSRGSGIYVIGGTQTPRVRIVTGAIKANFPARLTFRLPSAVDSKTIINTKGAENLISKGDMLYASPARFELTRLHAPLTTIQEVKAVVQSVMSRDLKSTDETPVTGMSNQTSFKVQ